MRDIRWLESGDMALSPSGEILDAEGGWLTEQLVRIVLTTLDPDWYGEAVGANLEELTGMLRPQALSEGKQRIEFALAQVLPPERFAVRAVAGTGQEVIFLVAVLGENGNPVTYSCSLPADGAVAVRRV